MEQLGGGGFPLLPPASPSPCLHCVPKFSQLDAPQGCPELGEQGLVYPAWGADILWWGCAEVEPDVGSVLPPSPSSSPSQAPMEQPLPPLGSCHPTTLSAIVRRGRTRFPASISPHPVAEPHATWQSPSSASSAHQRVAHTHLSAALPGGKGERCQTPTAQLWAPEIDPERSKSSLKPLCLPSVFVASTRSYQP